MTNVPARIPANLIENRRIGKMPVNRRFYSVPWAMDVDPTGGCWLLASYMTHTTPFGTAQMGIERREDGFHVWPAPYDFRYTPNYYV